LGFRALYNLAGDPFISPTLASSLLHLADESLAAIASDMVVRSRQGGEHWRGSAGPAVFHLCCSMPAELRVQYELQTGSSLLTQAGHALASSLAEQSPQAAYSADQFQLPVAALMLIVSLCHDVTTTRDEQQLLPRVIAQLGSDSCILGSVYSHLEAMAACAPGTLSNSTQAAPLPLARLLWMDWADGMDLPVALDAISTVLVELSSAVRCMDRWAPGSVEPVIRAAELIIRMAPLLPSQPVVPYRVGEAPSRDAVPMPAAQCSAIQSRGSWAHHVAHGTYAVGSNMLHTLAAGLARGTVAVVQPKAALLAAFGTAMSACKLHWMCLSSAQGGSIPLLCTTLEVQQFSPVLDSAFAVAFGACTAELGSCGGNTDAQEECCRQACFDTRLGSCGFGLSLLQMSSLS
jgi:hypothetical protein